MTSLREVLAARRVSEPIPRGDDLHSVELCSRSDREADRFRRLFSYFGRNGYLNGNAVACERFPVNGDVASWYFELVEI